MNIEKYNKRHLIIAFFTPLVLGLLFHLSPYIGDAFHLLPGDLGDTRFNIFILEHAKQFMTGEVSEYWNANFMYPEPEVISLSDNLLGTSPIYALFRILGFDLFTSFQYWLITLTILNYWASFKLSNFLFKSPWIAGLSAFIFTFSISLASQMNHAQMYPRFAIPLAFLGLLLWRKQLNWKYFAFAITMLVYQFYCGIYLGFLMLIPFLIVMGVIVYEQWTTLKVFFLKVKNLVQYGLPIIFNGVFMYILFAPYLRRSEGESLHTFSEIAQTLPGFNSYLTPPPGTVVHGFLEGNMGNHFAFWDHWIFTGWMATIAFVIIIVLLVYQKVKQKTILSSDLNLMLLAGVITFIAYLRVGDLSLYYFVQKIPGFGAMRSLTRVINVELLFFGIAFGALALLLIKKYNIKIKHLFFVALPFLIVDNFLKFEMANTTPKETMLERHYNLVEKMDHLQEGTIVSYEPDTSSLNSNIMHYQIDAMLAAQDLHLKSINGYSAKAAFGFDRFWRVPNKENLLFWLNRFPEVDTSEIVVIK
ncbi:MAG: hypothetical protein WED10_07370 [Brumimicrobium sp.]